MSADKVNIWGDVPVSPKEYSDRSLLLMLVQSVVFVLWCLSLIEYWKIAFVATAQTQDIARRRRSLAIDLYMLFKWVILLLLIAFGVTHWFGIVFASYLIASSVFSYFYYHIWREQKRTHSHVRQLRRYVAFLISFFFGIVGYAYILRFGHADGIEWSNGDPNMQDALLLSLSNAFTASFSDSQPLTQAVQRILAGETLFVFLFIVVVIVNSVPSR